MFPSQKYLANLRAIPLKRVEGWDRKNCQTPPPSLSIRFQIPHPAPTITYFPGHPPPRPTPHLFNGIALKYK